MRRCVRIAVLLLAGLASLGWFSSKRDGQIESLRSVAIEALAGSTLYSSKLPFSKTIDAMYLGYDKSGKAGIGVAMRYFKTYEKVTAMLVVRRENGKYVVTRADIPDITLIKNEKKQKNVMAAIKGVVDKVVRDEKGQSHKIDAVTGATRYQKRIYLSFDIMAKNLIENMENPPDWARQPLPQKAPQ